MMWAILWLMLCCGQTILTDKVNQSKPGGKKIALQAPRNTVEQQPHLSEQAEKLLVTYKHILVAYKGYTSAAANKEEEIFSKNSDQRMLQEYYAVVGTLSRAQMCDLMKWQIEKNLGFTAADAQAEIDSLSTQSLSAIKDRCMQYQYVLLGDQNPAHAPLDQQQRLQEIQQQYDAAQSTVAKLPLVKNIAAMLPTMVIDATSQQLYTKIAQAMKHAGVHEDDVDDEIARLKSLSVTDLQQEFSLLHQQLTRKMYYFQGSVDQASSFKKNMDFVMQQIHQWGTTAAGLAAAGVQSMGYEAGMLTAVSTTLLLDPNLTFSTAINKRNMLEMILLQYEGFNQMRDHFINVDFTPTPILSKAALLEQLQEQLIALHISAPDRAKYLEKYQAYSKDDLQHLVDDMKLHSSQQSAPNLSEIEQHALTMNKQDLLDNIRLALQYLQVPRDKVDATMTELQNLNTKLLKTVYIDTTHALGNPHNMGKVPQFFTTPERAAMLPPKVASAFALSYTEPAVDKSPTYNKLRAAGLVEHVQHRVTTTVDRGVETAMHMNAARTMTNSVRTMYDTARSFMPL